MDKVFDCLQMKEEIQARVYETTKNMTFPELSDYLYKSLENDTFWQRLIERNKSQKRIMTFA